MVFIIQFLKIARKINENSRINFQNQNRLFITYKMAKQNNNDNNYCCAPSIFFIIENLKL